MQLRHLRVMSLALLLACTSMSCAPKLVGPTGTSAYFFSVQVSDPEIWLLLEGSSLAERFPNVADLTVRVQHATGQPVDGVPVTFEVEPAWEQDASVTPQTVITRAGTARAVFRAKTIGVVRVVVRVDDTAQETNITVSPTPGRGDGGGDGGT